jgi:hypothetical protein
MGIPARELPYALRNNFTNYRVLFLHLKDADLLLQALFIRFAHSTLRRSLITFGIASPRDTGRTGCCFVHSKQICCCKHPSRPERTKRNGQFKVISICPGPLSLFLQLLIKKAPF